MAKLTQPIPMQAFELIRNRIADILVDEITEQLTLENTDLFVTNIFLERYPAFDKTEMPCINVSLARGGFDNEDQVSSDGTYSFHVDCYAQNPYIGNQDGSVGNGDTLAALKVQRLIAFCRAVLMNPAYKTLGFAPPFIANRSVSEFNIGNPSGQDMENTIMSRVTVTVRVPEDVEAITPPLIDGYDTSVKMGLTDLGYAFGGEGFVPDPECAPVQVNINSVEFTEVASGTTLQLIVEDTDGTQVGSKVGAKWIVPAGNICSDATVNVNGTLFKAVASGGTLNLSILNSNNDHVGTSDPSNNKVNIGDSTVQLFDSDNDPLPNPWKNIPVKAEETIQVVIDDSFATINKSDGVQITQLAVKSVNSVIYNVADSVIRLEDSAATLISNTNVKATDPATIVAPDGAITVNSAAFSSVESNGTENIVVKDTDGTVVGSKVGTEWIVPAGGAVPSGVLFDFPFLQQRNSYRDGDEGWRQQNGWNNITIPANPKAIAELDESIGANYWFKLASPLVVNGVSSTTRFVDVNGVQSFGVPNNIEAAVVDKLTGLMYTRNPWLFTPATWNNNIDNALAYSITIGGVLYDDWFLFSVGEAVQIFGSFFGQTTNDPITSATILQSLNSFLMTATTLEYSGNCNIMRTDALGFSGIQWTTKANSFTPMYIRKCTNLITAP